MNQTNNFFVKSYQIPDTLWRRSATDAEKAESLLVLPPLLVQVYRELLVELGLRQTAENQMPNDEGPQGGITVEATHEHFSRNFSGSCARVQLVTLDPNEVFQTTRNALVRLFAGGELSLLDIPCGAGAAGATLLCLVAELRRQAVLPRQPLWVTIVAGDISVPARMLKRRLYEKLSPRLKEFGIEVKIVIRRWDVEDEDQTSELVAAWIKRRQVQARTGLLAVNFSGFLHNRVNRCAGQLREILRFARLHGATVFWIEPQTNQALTGLFPGLQRYVLSRVSKLKVSWSRNPTPRQADCGVVQPVQRQGRFRARAAALHLESAMEVKK
jgi:hypothetical protein